MDNETPFRTPPFAGRNILIFSDGTGQAGGLMPDEARSNVYKLYRATRCGPDTCIDPDKQLAFYDPGLGSKGAGADIKVGWLRWAYNALSAATGLGITRNIVECYAALLYLWRPGDRIYLFGFSRGTYTVRCLGGVLSLCGIAQTMPDGSPLKRDPTTLRRVALEAVRRVYRHGSGAGEKSEHEDDRARARRERLAAQREALGAQFRKKYGSDTPDGPNAIPYFIGVWDTVAAVGVSPPAWRLIKIVSGLLGLGIAAAIAWWRAGAFDAAFIGWFVASLATIAAAVLAVNIGLRAKFVTDLPGWRWYQTMHLTGIKMAFFDKSLNARVRYARHALAIDERRADFDRVPWINHGKPPNRELDEGAWFQQIWFAGNHSDIGGSYPENESRLSDLALGWMMREARRAGLIVDDRYLNLFGRADGPQHDECRAGIHLFGRRFDWREATRKMVPDATLHWSVRQRFEGGPVLVYDEERRYRPALLAGHDQFKAVFVTEAEQSKSTPRIT